MKLLATDNLAPIRKQLVDLIEPGSRVIEFGSGDGQLLFELSPKIKYGVGIDKSRMLIDYCIRQKEKKNVSNVDFLCEELGDQYLNSETYHFAVASLFFHVLPTSQAVSLLKKMKALSHQLLICAFTRPETLQQKTLLWLDQRFSDHYKNFSAYQKKGYLEALLGELPSSTITVYDTPIPFIKIYKID